MGAGSGDLAGQARTRRGRCVGSAGSGGPGDRSRGCPCACWGHLLFPGWVDPPPHKDLARGTGESRPMPPAGPHPARQKLGFKERCPQIHLPLGAGPRGGGAACRAGGRTAAPRGGQATCPGTPCRCQVAGSRSRDQSQNRPEPTVLGAGGPTPARPGPGGPGASQGPAAGYTGRPCGAGSPPTHGRSRPWGSTWARTSESRQREGCGRASILGRRPSSSGTPEHRCGLQPAPGPSRFHPVTPATHGGAERGSWDRSPPSLCP